MSEEADKTQSRPPVQRIRRQRSERPASADRPSEQRTRAQNARRQRGQEQGRTRGPRNGSGQRARSSKARPSHSKAPAKRSALTVPLIPMLILLVVSVVSAVFITRCTMSSQIEAAKASATTAQSQVEELAGRVEDEKASADTSDKTSGNSSTSSSSSASSSNGTESKTASKENASGGTGTSGSSKVKDGVEDPWLTSGVFSTGDATLDKEVKEFCDGIADKSMKLDDAALEVYKSVAWSEYVERDDAQNPAGKDWRIEYARKYYEHDRSGNCYEFAAFLMYCLRYLGYEDAMAEGVIIELQSGGWGDHGIVYVTNTDGSSCMCDTARGTDGWMLPVGAYNVQIEDLENA